MKSKMLAIPIAVLLTATCIATGELKQTAQAQKVETSQLRDGVPRNSVAPTHGIPSTQCRSGFGSQGSRLCMTGTRGPDSFTNAMLACMDLSGRVADYHDWRYRRFRGDGAIAPVGYWLGGITDDDTALYVNSSNDGNFDGETSRFESRYYVCAHDRS